MKDNLFAKFGAKFELGQFYPSYERSKKAALAPPDWLVFSLKSGLGSDATNVGICYYCLGEKREAKVYGREAVEYVLEYFYGKWRKEIKTGLGTYDPEWWRTHVSWASSFSEALCWASSLGDWKSVRRLAEYPTKESKPGVDATREEAAMYVALACFLRNDAPNECEECFNVIQKGGNQKAKLVSEVVRALQANDERKLQESLKAYFEYFRKREFKRTKLSKLLCLDGTTLLNVGKRQGFDFKAPPEVEDHIIRF